MKKVCGKVLFSFFCQEVYFLFLAAVIICYVSVYSTDKTWIESSKYYNWFASSVAMCLPSWSYNHRIKQNTIYTAGNIYVKSSYGDKIIIFKVTGIKCAFKILTITILNLRRQGKCL